MRIFSAIGLALMAACSPAFGQFEGEVLWATAPPGFKIDYQAKNDDMGITELVPEKQSVHDWSEMVTIQVFYGLKTSPGAFMERTEGMVKEACPSASVAEVRHGEENGYPFNLFLMDCPLNTTTGKPEITWFKTIEGQDSFYVVQFATKLKPTKEKITKWMQYLRSVVVCDTRLHDRSCAPVSSGSDPSKP